MNDIYEIAAKIKPFTTLYGKNIFHTFGLCVDKDIRDYAIAAVTVAKREISEEMAKHGYLVEFDDKYGYPDKIVFRKKDTSVYSSKFPDYFRIDSFSGNIIR